MIFVLKVFDQKVCKILKEYKDMILNKESYIDLKKGIVNFDFENKSGIIKSAKSFFSKFFKQNKKIVSVFLNEIYELYVSLMNSSKDLDRIFQIPLRLIKAKTVNLLFIFRDIR